MSFGDLSPPVAAALITVSGVLGAALFAFIAALVNARTSKNNAIIQAKMAQNLKLAEFRQAWINDLRQCLIEIQSMHLPEHKLDMDFYFKIVTKVQLMTNSNEVTTKNLIDSIGKLKFGGTDDGSSQAHSDFRKSAQKILKNEWKVLKDDLENSLKI